MDYNWTDPTTLTARFSPLSLHLVAVGAASSADPPFRDGKWFQLSGKPNFGAKQRCPGF